MPLLQDVNLVGLALALILPWLAGAALVAAAVPGARPAVIAGHGYLTGQIAVIGALLLLDALGTSLAFLPGASVLSLVTAIAVWSWWRQGGRLHCPAIRFRASTLWHLLWLLPLAAFVFERGGVLLQELALRPLFAWDAWMNWAPKAVVWFHHETLTPFVAPDEWLRRSSDELVYTLGNWRASDYPRGVPLLLLWTMLGAETADHTLLYLPWLVLPASLALALWGHLRGDGLAPALSALAVYALLSQPLLDTHAVLAGYADLWLAAAFGLGAMALSEWQRRDQPRYAVLAVVMALGCLLFKTPGLVFAGLLLAATALLAWRPPGRWLWWVGSSFGLLLLVGLLVGLLWGSDPGGGALLRLGLPSPLPDLRIGPAPLLPYLWESIVLDANWHLLWPLFFVTLLTSVFLRGRETFHEVGLLLLLAGLAFLLSVFGFTHYFRQVENAVTFNRALLYLAPLVVYATFQGLSRCMREGKREEECT